MGAKADTYLYPKNPSRVDPGEISTGNPEYKWRQPADGTFNCLSEPWTPLAGQPDGRSSSDHAVAIERARAIKELVTRQSLTSEALPTQSIRYLRITLRGVSFCSISTTFAMIPDAKSRHEKRPMPGPVCVGTGQVISHIAVSRS